MEPITMLIVGAVYAARAIEAEIRANKVKKNSSSYTSLSSSSSSFVSQPKIKTEKENRMCQPEIDIKKNNRVSQPNIKSDNEYIK
ncbi:hypothetical protein AAH145_04980 [Bacteroides thetaiotaomicron]|uniref:hypothetical protein n=1 Tax=Bacteroidaceae TaxID=815 RepID=UPI0039B3D287